MKKLVVLFTLVGVMTFSIPVMASSPTANTVLPQASQQNVDSAVANLPSTPATQAISQAEKQTVTSLANDLVSSGAATTPAAAVAVATSVVKIESATPISSAEYENTAKAVYDSLPEATKAIYQQAAAVRNLSVEEVTGNFVKADPTIEGSGAIAWDSRLSVSSVNGKSGNVNVIISKPSAAESKTLVDNFKKAFPTGKVINTFTPTLQGGVKGNSVETGFSVEGIKATDAGRVVANQIIDGAIVPVKVTKVVDGGIAVLIKASGPITVGLK